MARASRSSNRPGLRETGGAITLFLATAPRSVSTTHTITGAIGASARPVARRRCWAAQRIVFAWVLTLPAAALIGAFACWAVRQL
jgi:PiT family inorganic phosphate transporter